MNLRWLWLFDPLLRFCGRTFTNELRGINYRLWGLVIEYPFDSQLIIGCIVMKIPGPVCDCHYVRLNHPLYRTFINYVGLIVIYMIPQLRLEPGYLWPELIWIELGYLCILLPPDHVESWLLLHRGECARNCTLNDVSWLQHGVSESTHVPRRRLMKGLQISIKDGACRGLGTAMAHMWFSSLMPDEQYRRFQLE